MTTGFVTTRHVGKQPQPDRLIHLAAKRAGKRSAGNLHAAFDVAGAGNGTTARLVRHSHRKRGVTDRPDLPSPRQSSTLPAHPTAQWTAQQVIEAFPEDSAPRFLLRDRDSIYASSSASVSSTWESKKSQ
jgi:hypothetical protein